MGAKCRYKLGNQRNFRTHTQRIITLKIEQISVENVAITDITARCEGMVRGVTFVVHVGGDLHHAQAQVHWQVVKVIVRLQDKLSSQLHAVPIFIHFINQDGIKVLILYTHTHTPLKCLTIP